MAAFEKLLTTKASGISFILDPASLIRAKEEAVHKMHYVQLAAKRMYASYTLLGKIDLDISPYIIDLQTLKFNPLITIVNKNTLSFIFEERYKKWHH